VNLHNIAFGYVGAVNPLVTAMMQASTGSTTNADGSRVPTYAAPVPVSCQIQSLQYNDIVMLQGVNIQGVREKVYINGKWEGIVRADRRGGDLLTMPDGTVYLVAMVLEHWPDWSCLAVTEQVPSSQ
jgi:hypothetical protein